MGEETWKGEPKLDTEAEKMRDRNRERERNHRETDRRTERQSLSLQLVRTTRICRSELLRTFLVASDKNPASIRWRKKRQALKSHPGGAPSEGGLKDQTLEKDRSPQTRDRPPPEINVLALCLSLCRDSVLPEGALHVQGSRPQTDRGRCCPQGQFTNSPEGHLLAGIHGP